MAKYERSPDDDKYHCDDCDAVYDLPQHLGLHRRREHGVAGAPRKKSRPLTTPEDTGIAAVARRRRRKALPPEVVCRAVLIDMVPDGKIPIDMIEDYNAWVKATRAFLAKISLAD